jgi:hypothetical protein
LNRKTIVAIHGLQGSGKTTLATNLLHIFTGTVGVVSIKSSFKKYADTIMQDVHHLLPLSAVELAHKELQRAVSTWGERFAPHIWSRLYSAAVMESPFSVVITDDVRTDMNIMALCKLSETNNVMLVRLICGEEARKARVSVWREITDYTERLLPAQDDLQTFSVDTGEFGATEVADAVVAKLAELGWANG